MPFPEFPTPAAYLRISVIRFRPLGGVQPISAGIEVCPWPPGLENPPSDAPPSYPGVTVVPPNRTISIRDLGDNSLHAIYLGFYLDASLYTFLGLAAVHTAGLSSGPYSARFDRFPHTEIDDYRPGGADGPHWRRMRLAHSPNPDGPMADTQQFDFSLLVQELSSGDVGVIDLDLVSNWGSPRIPPVPPSNLRVVWDH
jgi:hypothetical protein